MTFEELKYHFIKSLSHHYQLREINSFFNMILFHFKKWNKIDFSLNKKELLNLNEKRFFDEKINLLKKGNPLQYIIGEVFFYQLLIKVNEHVLIPRPETEELVHLIYENKSKKSLKNILDIGTGSGCIILALKSIFSDSDCIGLDISKEAIKTAKKNAALLKLDVEFIVDDIFNTNVKRKFDAIVSNPPYITLKEKRLMENNVLNHEPHMALFVDDFNPLIYYKAIAEFGIQSLTKEGEIYFEINEKYGDEVVYLLKDLGYHNCEIKKDLQGKNRFVLAQLG